MARQARQGKAVSFKKSSCFFRQTTNNLYTYPPEFQAQKVNKCLILYRRKEDKKLKKKQKKAGTALNALIVTPSNNTNKL